MAEKERSTEDIRQDIAREEENISQTAHKIGQRIKEKMDWTAYVRESPYFALGVAAFAGYLGSRMLVPRTPPLERIMNTVAHELRDSMRGGLGSASPGTLASLAGIATKVATDLIKTAATTAKKNTHTKPLSETERPAAHQPEAQI